jgi:hypothetical protein
MNDSEEETLKLINIFLASLKLEITFAPAFRKRVNFFEKGFVKKTKKNRKKLGSSIIEISFAALLRKRVDLRKSLRH